jgi:hypothetical protein
MGRGTTMEPRISFPKVTPGGLQAMLGLSNHLRNSGQRVRRSFTEKELTNLTLAIAEINSWNRINVALRTSAETISLPNRRPL